MESEARQAEAKREIPTSGTKTKRSGIKEKKKEEYKHTTRPSQPSD